MRNKVLSILIVAVYLFQSVTVQPVSAAPLLQTPDYSAVNFVKNINTAPTEDGDLVNVQLANAPIDTVVTANNFGIGTAVANASVDVTTTCETTVCPSIAVHVVVNNQDPLNERKLYACMMVTQDDPAWDTWVLFSTSVDNYGFHPPYARCKTYTVPASTDVAVTLPIWTGTGAEGDPRVIHASMAFSWAEVDTCGTPFVPMGSTVTKTIDVNTYDPVSQSQPDQVYDVTPGNYYKLNTDGFYSADYQEIYTTDYIHISWDNVTWQNIELYDSQCFESEGDTTAWYLLAESDKLYVRVGDGTLGDTSFYGHPTPYGNSYLADDHVADGETFAYMITEGIPPQTCDNQFAYAEGDVLTSITVPANAELGVVASDLLTPGEWYSVVVTSGTWQDEGTGPERVDMEYKVYGDAGYNEDAAFHDFNSGTGSWCSSITTGTFYIQAQNTTIDLRVNNLTGGFTSNTGSLNVSIYAATFTRALGTCEQSFTLSGLQAHDTVAANAANGKAWGIWSGPGSGTSGIGTASAGTLVPGAWYVVDTSDGPWTQHGSGLLGTAHPVSGFYDMAVSDNGTSWIPLEDWTVPVCNVQIDSLGHRRIYFQAPDTAAFTWYFRVNDNDGNFGSNAGELGWNLYRATYDNGGAPGSTLTDPWASCGDTYEHRVIYNAGTSIPVQEEEGTYLRQSLLGVASSSQDPIPANASGSMSVGDVYKLTIKEGPWLDGTDEHYDAAVSPDDGANWYALSDDTNPDVDCISADQQARYYSIMFTVKSGQRWKVRVNDDAGDFVGNGGNLSYVMYKLTHTAAGLGEAGTSTSSASGLGIASGGLAVCIQTLMYPTFSSVQGVFTQPATPTGFDVWEWVSWLGEAQWEFWSSFATYLPNFISAGFNYGVSWIRYAVLATQKFFAFCPKSEGLLMSAINVIKSKEPFASVIEIITFVTDVKDRLNAYDWGSYENTSLFAMTSTSKVQGLINNYILRRDAAVTSPWSGSGSLVTFGSSDLPSYYYSCSTAFTDYLPTRLRSAMCFVSAYWKQTGAAMWIQLLVVDIGAISIAAMGTKRALQELIYMMTGVKPWTKSAASALGMDKLLSYMERQDRDAEIDAMMRRRRR